MQILHGNSRNAGADTCGLSRLSPVLGIASFPLAA